MLQKLALVCAILVLVAYTTCQRFDQWRPVAQQNPPTPRYNFDGACYKDQILVFGGRGETWLNFTSDTHLFNYHTRTWNVLQYADGAAPIPRFGASIAIMNENMYMFGGAYYTQSNVLVVLSDTWKFDFKTKTWTQETISGFVPPPLYEGHTFPYESKGYFCVWSGHNKTDVIVLQSTYCYNVNTKTWTDETNTFKNVPYQRFGGMTQTIVDGKHVLFGGRTNGGNQFFIKPTNFLNDTWILDMDTKTWKEIQVPISNRPKQRYNSQGVVITDHLRGIDYLVMYGGENLVSLGSQPYGPTYEYFSDTWVLNMKTGEWRDVTSEAGTGPLQRSAAIACSYNNYIHLWGGKRNYADPDEVIYNDMWGVFAGSLTPSAAVKPVISAAVVLLIALNFMGIF